MKKRKVLYFLFSGVCLWLAASYFLITQCPNCFREDDTSAKYNEQVNILETKIQSLVNTNNILYRNIKIHLNYVSANALVEKIMLLNGNDNADTLNIKPDVSDTTRMRNQVRSMVPKVDEKPFHRLDSFTYANTSNQESIIQYQLQLIPKKTLEDGRPVIAVLVFSCDRVTVRRSLDRLLRFRPSKEQFPIIVSQDCSHKPTTEAILSFGDDLFWVRQPNQSDIQVPPKEKKFKGYFKIARHYGWALNYTFKVLKFSTVIIVEDDLDVSEDFFEYFMGTYWLLREDPTLWCISAWNDNGFDALVDKSQPQLLYRTDFFPGLGWMLTDKLWSELSNKWPLSYWDDWIRKPEQRKNRACIRPEVSRTKTFGKIGVSNGLFFEKHLKYIKLNEEFVIFTQMNLSYLLKDNYDPIFVKQVYESPIVNLLELKSGQISHQGPVRVSYRTRDEYKKLTKQLGLMDDFRSGVPRTAYRGVVTFWYKNRRVYIAPNRWRGYNVTWS